MKSYLFIFIAVLSMAFMACNKSTDLQPEDQQINTPQLATTFVQHYGIKLSTGDTFHLDSLHPLYTVFESALESNMNPDSTMDWQGVDNSILPIHDSCTFIDKFRTFVDDGPDPSVDRVWHWCCDQCRVAVPFTCVICRTTCAMENDEPVWWE